MSCGTCGAQIPDGASFCPSCGGRQPPGPPPLDAGSDWGQAVRQARGAPRPPSSSRIVWIVGGIAALLLVAVAVSAALAFGFGMKVLNEQVRVELRDNPVIRARIGEPGPLELDFMGTAADPGDDVFVFRVEGPLGRGRVTANLATREDGTEEVTGGTLRLDSGEEFGLFPDEGEEGAEEEAGTPPQGGTGAATRPSR